MNEVVIGVASAAGGALLIYLGSLVRSFISRRIYTDRRESTTLAMVVPAVNALLDIQGPQTEALIALLEAQQGKCNGNVDKALKTASAARERFDGFLLNSARISESKYGDT